jgi:hypothetical protein
VAVTGGRDSRGQAWGLAATDVYLAAAGSANQSVRQYGLDVLAAEGDDRACDLMLAKVGEIFSRERISYSRWDELLMAVSCLAARCPAALPGQIG